MRLAILGGGGFRVPLVYRALLGDTGEPRVRDVALYDPAPDRLTVIESVLAGLASGVPDPPRVSSTTDLDGALSGADFVFCAMRVGGLSARANDERVALRLGVLGQETSGAGGIAFGLRTVPVAVRVAERIRTVCPHAHVVNFTNPAGMITEAMQSVLGERVVGICDTPRGLTRRVAAALDLDPARVHFDYVGLNHLGWLRRAVCDGRDRLPDLLSDSAALGTLEETAMFGASWIRTLGCVPNEYLYYYYFTRDAIRSILAGENTRGEFLLGQQSGFYSTAAASPDRAAELWRETVAERDALYMAEATGGRRHAETDEGYEGVALAVMAAIARNEHTTMVLNARNGSAVAGLDPSAVVEVPSTVDATGVHPLATATPEPHQLGLMQQVKAVERLTIEAALTGSPDAAVKAFALHPLVDSVSVARDLLRAYAEAIPEVAAVISR